MVTIKQIAQEVGISSSTVSIVLGGKAAERKISTATQEKIFAAAARLGYQPQYGRPESAGRQRCQ